ncbi:phenylacetate--CoA ligase family protein [Aestuariibaculum sp. M13]|uniref:phenylacetate--CoA ligase family protein n=1 Tax=Aestuariibaculum sp. M13 TaxID=2967132 RepID=UPI002159DBAB|nr:phenylacetate--CoA ligase family protein [Aestuariibaculum sp. M13]MCR8667193.1 phenylacetate--CoA ligase family protein [Aestuariibaculum sp. M13]
MNLFNLSLKLKGFPIQETNHLLHQIQSISEDKYADYLNKQKQAIIAYHLKHNPFYKTFAKNANPNDWNSIPVITKRDLQQPLSNRLSEGFSKKNSFVNKTSGSSGDPFIFVKDKFCHALTWSEIFDRYSWYDINLNTSKQARFYGIPLNKKGYYKERIKDVLGNRHRFSVFDLSDSEFEKCITKFKSTTFEYLNGYTSSIVQFAKFLEKKNLLLKDICPTLKVCIVTSEMLFQEDRTLLETQFGIPVINEYGAAELGVIAFQNLDNQWIVNSEDLFIEILDENNQVLPYGQTGRVVITSLYNKAHPFIRYDLGDIGTLSNQSTLKIPILKNLTGRTNDLVKLPSGKTAAGLTFYYVTKTVIEDSGNVKEFIIEQTQINTFKISYVSNTPLSEKDKMKIKAAIEIYLESGLVLKFEQKERLNREKSGKLKQFKSFV